MNRIRSTRIGSSLLMGNSIVDKSVNLRNVIDNNQPTEAVLQRIREDHIAQVSVTVVLIGSCTWQRKYVGLGNRG